MEYWNCLTGISLSYSKAERRSNVQNREYGVTLGCHVIFFHVLSIRDWSWMFNMYEFIKLSNFLHNHFQIWEIKISSSLRKIDFPGGSDGKASAYNVGDLGSIPGSGRSPGEGNGNLLQYSCLENPMDGGAWQATVHEVAKSWWRLSNFTFTWER